MIESGNNKGTHVENVRQTPINSTDDPKLGNSYAKLFTKETSRKSVNIRTLITLTGNGADVAVPLKSIRAINVVRGTHADVIKMKSTNNQLLNYQIDMGGTLIMIQAKEVTGWVLDFVEDMSKIEVEGKNDNSMVFDNELIKQSAVAKEVDDKSDPIFLPSFTPSLSPTSKVGASVSMGDKINEVFKQNIKKQGGQEDGEDLNANEKSIEEVMADKGKKSIMDTFAPNDKADYYFGITSITVNGKNAYELKGKFLDDLHNNAFSGTNGKDAVEHIEYFLKIVGPINLPNVDHDKLRVIVFPISLVGGGDEIEVSNDESSDLEEYWSNKEEITKNFKIETDVFDYETPLYLAFNEFNYLIKVDPNLLTKDIMGFKTYEDYKNDWIYEWNENVPWLYDKPWLDNGIWKEPKPIEHTSKPFNYKTRCSEWPTCSWREDDYCNGGNLPGTYHIVNSLHYQDLEWYEALEDIELKNEALRNKAIMEGENEYETHEERHELYGIETREVLVCQIKRYKMIRYSFNDEEEYVAVKEDEYNDFTITSDEACRAYQKIFRMMDEGWMVMRTK
ncbi:hypothetical protein Tco_0514447 [Tanacetum coccineum]